MFDSNDKDISFYSEPLLNEDRSHKGIIIAQNITIFTVLKIILHLLKCYITMKLTSGSSNLEQQQLYFTV